MARCTGVVVLSLSNATWVQERASQRTSLNCCQQKKTGQEALKVLHIFVLSKEITEKVKSDSG